MRRLSEVCKIVGVTRRTLQEYDKIKLLSPTAKTEAGYWLYDDDAIKTLIAIQTFVEVGYKRNDIKILLESPAFDILEELDHVISDLEDKRKRIDGMINTIKYIKRFFTLMASASPASSKFDIARFYKDKSFVSCLEESFTHYSESGISVSACISAWFYFLCSIGSLADTPEDSAQVQDNVERAFRAYKNMYEIMKTEDEESVEDYTELELAELHLEFLQDILNDPEALQVIEFLGGTETMQYIVRAVQVFCDRKTRQEVVV